MDPRQIGASQRKVGNSRRQCSPSARVGALRPPTIASRDRRERLARLLPLMPKELEDDSLGGRLRLVARLKRALRAERCRGLAGHWTYDLARHVALLHCYREEVAALPRRLRPPQP